MSLCIFVSAMMHAMQKARGTILAWIQQMVLHLHSCILTFRDYAMTCFFCCTFQDELTSRLAKLRQMWESSCGYSVPLSDLLFTCGTEHLKLLQSSHKHKFWSALSICVNNGRGAISDSFFYFLLGSVQISWSASQLINSSVPCPIESLENILTSCVYVCIYIHIM